MFTPNNMNNIKLNGFRPSHRNKWRFIQYGILTLQQLCLLEFYADIFDFDKNHPGFGLFVVNFGNFSEIFNTSSDNTIRNWHNKLLELGFIKPTGIKNVYRLAIHDRYINPGKWEGKASDYARQEKDQRIEVILQNFGIDTQLFEKSIQSFVHNHRENEANGTSIAIASSKDEYKDNPVIIPSIRSEAEYQRMYLENGCTGLTPEEMRWIDENVSENDTPPPKQSLETDRKEVKS